MHGGSKDPPLQRPLTGKRSTSIVDHGLANRAISNLQLREEAALARETMLVLASEALNPVEDRRRVEVRFRDYVGFQAAGVVARAL